MTWPGIGVSRWSHLLPHRSSRNMSGHQHWSQRSPHTTHTHAPNKSHPRQHAVRMRERHMNQFILQKEMMSFSSGIECKVSDWCFLFLPTDSSLTFFTLSQWHDNIIEILTQLPLGQWRSSAHMTNDVYWAYGTRKGRTNLTPKSCRFRVHVSAVSVSGFHVSLWVSMFPESWSSAML